MSEPHLGILGAMPQEIEDLRSELGASAGTHERGMRSYHSGTLWGAAVTLAFSRCGKVSAASTATHLISHCGVNAVLFTGVAGGIHPDLRIGDVVVATELLQHDLDARPIFPRYEVPLLGRARFESDAPMRARLLAAAQRFVNDELPRATSAERLAAFGIDSPRVVEGVVASGDQFVAERDAVERMRRELPEVQCVEMEGAAVAQVCHEHGVPFAIVRVISDTADEHAPVEFERFLRDIARLYSHGIVRRMLSAVSRP